MKIEKTTSYDVRMPHKIVFPLYTIIKETHPDYEEIESPEYGDDLKLAVEKWTDDHSLTNDT